MLGDTLPTNLVEAELRRACREMERRLRAGEPCTTEDLLTACPMLAVESEAGIELAYAEFALRAALGQAPRCEEWFGRFPQWRDRLEKLFQIHDAVHVEPGPSAELGRSTFLDDADSATSPTLCPDRRVGGYELVSEVGRGGMGVVYKARQLGLNRLVALKMVLAGPHAGPEQRARFRREAEAAARLQHPNIVQVFEVGEHSGFPYLSMEFVDGNSLDRLLARWHAEGSTGMAPPETVRLVETLARAVEFAHRHGVVHRDLKPANILLVSRERKRPEFEGTQTPVAYAPGSPDDVPKITDFGLAKILDEAAEPTRTGTVLGTPCYMAPEQAEASRVAIGPATDVYALGVILYELLTGRPPFQGVTVLETLEQVRSADPLPPSGLQPNLSRDLETICLKCLEKDPRKRYAGAADLADDLQRYLSKKPIHARPVSAAARAWRWCQRKPAVASLTAALAVVVVISLVGLTFLWLRAERHLKQSRIHEGRARDSYQLARTSLEECVKKVADDPRVKSGPLEDLRRTVLQAETIFYQKFLALQGTDPDFQAERGTAFSRLGDVSAELGSPDQAVEHYRQAREVLSNLVRDHPDVAKYQVTLGTTHHQLANLYLQSGELDEAERAYQTALAMEDRLARDEPENALYRRNLIGTYNGLGNLYFDRARRARGGKPAVRDTLARSSEQAFQKAAALVEDWGRKRPTDPSARYPLAAVHINFGGLYFETRRLQEAERSLQTAVTILREFLRDNADHEDFVTARRALANSLNSLATVYLENQRREEARQAYQEAVTIQKDQADKHPLVSEYTLALGSGQSNLGNVLRQSGQFADALDWYANAIATLEPVLAKQPQDRECRTFLRNAHLGCAATLFELNRHADTLPHLDRTIELDDGEFRDLCRLQRARTLVRLKDHARATAEASALAGAKDVTADTLFAAACIFASSAATVPRGEPQSEQYAARAVALLRQALAAGYKDVQELKTDSDLDPLRARPDFKNLLADIQAGKKVKPGGEAGK